jgi:geranylgeranyl diphosphate synthase type 3
MAPNPRGQTRRHQAGGGPATFGIVTVRILSIVPAQYKAYIHRIDDIQDSSKLRRGFPVAHSIFGVAQTINSANFAYFWAQQELQKLGKPEALVIFTEEMLRLHRGQGMDLYWRDSLICPTEEEYLEMVANKTGGLFRLAIKLMQMESQNTK